MSSTILAIYENGVLRPLTPLDLPEQTQVQIEVQQVDLPENLQEQRRKIHETLLAAGLSKPKTFAEAEALAIPAEEDEEDEELANLFSQGKPLSEIIIEEREGR
jgi:predicted DNA-binding antitoxin AbrB/MazE fold protein